MALHLHQCLYCVRVSNHLHRIHSFLLAVSLADSDRLSSNKVNTAMRGIIPTEIGKLTSLERLVLGACRILGSIPTEIGEMTSLKHLDFEYSYFLSGKLPSELGRLVALTHLNVACTDIDGMIPDTLTNLTQLRDFDISKWPLSLRGCVFEYMIEPFWYASVKNVRRAPTCICLRTSVIDWPYSLIPMLILWLLVAITHTLLL
mmetsp:Transcript_22672/g.63236  ORF Transcript_22672/g.63236 Transcript_22672/m.63236 type:complete len:203 (-) Transcript_22672:1088-1696(-)